MSDTRDAAKRKAEELEAVPDAREDSKKRAKKGDEEEADGIPEVGGSDEEDQVDPDELEALDTTNVIEGGRRTRGVRVDYSKMKYDEEEEEEEEEELQGEEEEENQEEVYEVDGEDKAVEANEEDTQNIEKGTNGHDEDEDEEEE